MPPGRRNRRARKANRWAASATSSWARPHAARRPAKPGGGGRGGRTCSTRARGPRASRWSMPRDVAWASAGDSRSSSRAARAAAARDGSPARATVVIGPCSLRGAPKDTMRSSPRRRPGFSLLEVVIALAVLALAMTALAVPLTGQLQARRAEEARRQLDEAREAILGFAATHGRLPCPATAAARGNEAFAPGGDAVNGRCADFHGAFLPAAALALAPLDGEGFLRDPWGTSSNRVRYAVHAGTINAIPHALTSAGGMSRATLAGLGEAPHYLHVCVAGAPAPPSGCGPAASQLTRRAAFVVLSAGPNAAHDPPAGSDEARNLDGDASFVSREGAEGGYDDVVQWGSIHLLVHRLVAAG